MRACTMTAMAWKVSSGVKQALPPAPVWLMRFSRSLRMDGRARARSTPRVPPPYPGAHWRRHADRRSPGHADVIVIGADLEPGPGAGAYRRPRCARHHAIHKGDAAQVKHQPARCLLQTLISGTELGGARYPLRPYTRPDRCPLRTRPPAPQTEETAVASSACCASPLQDSGQGLPGGCI